MPGQPPRVLVVIGAQEFFAERSISAAVVAWQRLGAEISEVRGGAAGLLGELMSAASPDLFGSAPVIVLRDAEAMDEATASAVCEMLESDNDAAWIIQHAGSRGPTKAKARLQKVGTVVKVDAIKGRAVADFVQSEFRAHGKTADQGTISLLIDAIGADPRGLASAVAQLASDIEEPHIGREAAARYYSGHVEIKGYEIADAVASRNPAQALEGLRYAMHEGGTRAGLMTITALTTTFQRLAAAKSARGGSAAAADVAAALRIPEWMARGAVNQARGWSSDEIASAIGDLAELSVLMKGGYDADGALSDEQKEYVLERAVVRMATRQATT
jgi:DNA polymerase-3 subunit delta